MKSLILNILFAFFLMINFLFAKSDYFTEGVNLFKKKKFEEAQFKFEQDIVYNPKSELSYLYLSKIFNNAKRYIASSFCGFKSITVFKFCSSNPSFSS